MPTEENERGHRQVLDLIRMLAIIILLLHFYFYSYGAFRIWKLTNVITDRILQIITRTGLFDHFVNSKAIALGLLVICIVIMERK